MHSRDRIILDLQHPFMTDAGVEARRLGPMQLQHVQADELGDLPDLGGFLSMNTPDHGPAAPKAPTIAFASSGLTRRSDEQK